MRPPKYEYGYVVECIHHSRETPPRPDTSMGFIADHNAHGLDFWGKAVGIDKLACAQWFSDDREAAECAYWNIGRGAKVRFAQRNRKTRETRVLW